MNSILESKLKNLPNSPGIYQFLNENGKVIYVGKAKNLKNRVRTYFQNNHSISKDPDSNSLKPLTWN